MQEQPSGAAEPLEGNIAGEARAGSMRSRVRDLSKRVLPANLYRSLVLLTRWPPVGRVRFGALRRSTPLGDDLQEEPTDSISQHYIGQFLRDCAADLRGRVLLIGPESDLRRHLESEQTGPPQPTGARDQSGVEHVPSLREARAFSAASFTTIVCAQMLQYSARPGFSVTELHRILEPGGVLLATVPGISRSGYDPAGTVRWRFTDASARTLLEPLFPPGAVEVRTFGNVLVAAAHLHGLPANTLRPEELDHQDPDYQVLIAIRAEKIGAIS